ncbi:hypothetical protein FXO38_35912 [Capsicum annuum]|nr:hypothetical protein FXO38_35912 [Capsicum annuum]
MALASFRTDNAPKLKELYGELKSEGNGWIILTGKDVEIEGLTWIAKKSSGRAIVEGYFDFTILWELSFPNSDIRDIDDERLACKLSAFSPPDEWELENNTKEDKEIRTKKLLEILESKKVLLIFVHSAGIVDSLSMYVVSRRIRELKANLVREILVTTALDKFGNQFIAKGRVIEVKHKKNQINVQESLSSCCELIGKAINRTPGLQSKLLLEDILMDFCCYENKFPFKRGSAHYSELITYWILEGFLGPFDCFENAYEKGHCVIMVLAHHGFIENQQAGYVRKNVKMLDLSSCCCCRIEETVRLGLANVFEAKDRARNANVEMNSRASTSKTLHSTINPPRPPQNAISQVSNYPQNRDLSKPPPPQIDQFQQEELRSQMLPLKSNSPIQAPQPKLHFTKSILSTVAPLPQSQHIHVEEYGREGREG